MSPTIMSSPTCLTCGAPIESLGRPCPVCEDAQTAVLTRRDAWQISAFVISLAVVGGFLGSEYAVAQLIPVPWFLGALAIVMVAGVFAASRPE